MPRSQLVSRGGLYAASKNTRAMCASSAITMRLADQWCTSRISHPNGLADTMCWMLGYASSTDGR